jgi:hypothetical protein
MRYRRWSEEKECARATDLYKHWITPLLKSEDRRNSVPPKSQFIVDLYYRIIVSPFIHC